MILDILDGPDQKVKPKDSIFQLKFFAGDCGMPGEFGVGHGQPGSRGLQGMDGIPGPKGESGNDGPMGPIGNRGAGKQIILKNF